MSEFFAANLGPLPKGPLDWSRLANLSKAASAGASDWTKEEAFIAILFAAATCDGRLSGEEHEELLALVHRSRLLKALSEDQLTEISVRIASRLRSADSALCDACKALPEEVRLTAFTHALDLVLADGQLSQDEADFLNTLTSCMELNGEDVERVADAIIIKNRY